MLAMLKALFAPAMPERQDCFGDDGLRLAAAALLVRVASVESSKLANKRANLHAVIKRRFKLDDTSAANPKFAPQLLRVRMRTSGSKRH